MKELHREIIASIKDGIDYTSSRIAKRVWGQEAMFDQRSVQSMGSELRKMEKLGLVECVRRKDGLQTWRKNMERRAV